MESGCVGEMVKFKEQLSKLTSQETVPGCGSVFVDRLKDKWSCSGVCCPSNG